MCSAERHPPEFHRQNELDPTSPDSIETSALRIVSHPEDPFPLNILPAPMQSEREKTYSALAVDLLSTILITLPLSQRFPSFSALKPPLKSNTAVSTAFQISTQDLRQLLSFVCPVLKRCLSSEIPIPQPNKHSLHELLSQKKSRPELIIRGLAGSCFRLLRSLDGLDIDPGLCVQELICSHAILQRATLTKLAAHVPHPPDELRKEAFFRVLRPYSSVFIATSVPFWTYRHMNVRGMVTMFPDSLEVSEESGPFFTAEFTLSNPWPAASIYISDVQNVSTIEAVSNDDTLLDHCVCDWLRPFAQVAVSDAEGLLGEDDSAGWRGRRTDCAGLDL
ncbi:hypothetical protein BLNAU_4827 [Blattamonas nauphoetae]|uniref:Uncharacterized protein n=1 Tax=Blattamonas nauphoetae TaxID=2049346 RepID=A0ABQ9Y9E2_9EUKA|nr:hypothetical protein BLNAU_4827 [Blattamonas nauphoetae]